MRGLLGGIVLVAGVGGLGWFASQGPAVRMQDTISAAAAGVVGTAQHGVTADVSGRDITLTGTVEDAAEQAELIAALDAIPGRRVVNAGQIAVLPVVSPYTAEITKTEDATAVTGVVPSAAVRDALGLPDLAIANGEPEAPWGDGLAAVLAAVAPLKTAEVTVSDETVTVTGLAATPTELDAFETAIAAMPDGFTVSSDITLEDDGKPLQLLLQYDGATLSGAGKIPADLPAADIAIADVAANLNLQESVLPSADGQFPAFVGAALTALAATENGQIILEGQSMALNGEATPDGIAAAQAALADLPEGYSATTNIAIYDDGTPLRLALQYDGATLTGAGKIPADLAVADVTIAGASAALDLQEADIPSEDGLWPGAAAAGLSALGALQSGTLSMEATALSLAGTGTPEEIAAAEAALAALPDGYSADTDFTIFDDGTPLRLSLDFNGVALRGTGKIPADLAAADVAIEGAETALDLQEANIPSADGNWPAFASAGIDALGALNSGTLEIEDQSLTLTGVGSPDALAAAETSLAALPDGYSATTDLAIFDDGAPLSLDLSFDGATLTGSGKIPADLPLADLIIADADVTLDVQEADIPSEDGLWPAFATSAVAALGALENGAAQLDGQVVTLTGVATPDGIAAAEAALSELPDGYSAVSDVALFDDGTPFRLVVTKAADGLTASGKLSADFVDDSGILADAASDDLATAFITDPAGDWPGIATAGLAALAALDTGVLEVTGDQIALSGEAFAPEDRDAALSALGDLNAAVDVTVSEDSTPVSLSVDYAASSGITASGKLPIGLTAADLSTAIGADVDNAGLAESDLEAGVDLLAPLAAVRSFLPELSAMRYAASEETITLDATAAPGVDPTSLGTAIGAAVGEGVTVAVSALDTLPEDGATRTNLFTGAEEVFTAGYWLPTFDFFATPESCTAQSAAILERDQVQFLSGSADLDLQSIRAINALSALARKCAVEGGVFLQVAGHTDNTGDAEANLALSQARADAVRDAILARGIAGTVVTAVGFGDAQPIADNGTEEGRAANRRTAFIWNFE